MRSDKMKWTIKLLVVAVLLPWSVSCSTNDLGDITLNPVDCTNFRDVKYSLDIVPIIDKSCGNCHNSTVLPDKNWKDDPALFSSRADEAARRVQIAPGGTDHMPKSPPELTKEEIQLIVCWAKQGAPINN